jgi:hypothetical protein
MMSLVKWKDSWIESATIREVDNTSRLDTLIAATEQANDVDGTN